MKCPFCQQELEIGGVDGILRGCPKCRNLGTEMLWQALTDSMKEHDLCHDALVERTKELDRIRKALEQSETCRSDWEKQALEQKE